MPLPLPLAAGKLHATFDPAKLPWKSSTEIPSGKYSKSGIDPFQPRAMQALALALKIQDSSYHVYLSGESGLGRAYMLKSYLNAQIKEMPFAPNLYYAYNFEAPNKPLLIPLQDKAAINLAGRMREFLEDILSGYYDHLQIIKRKQEGVYDAYHNERQYLMRKMCDLAEKNNFCMEFDENLALVPLYDGKKINDTELQKLSPDIQLRIKQKGHELASNIKNYARKFNQLDKNLEEAELKMQVEAMEKSIDSIYANLQIDKFNDDLFKKWLKDLKRDILTNLPLLSSDNKNENFTPSRNPFDKYLLNAFVSNEKTPLVIEDNPTSLNLLGGITKADEQQPPDHMCLQSGSLHRANGGFLILHIDDLLRHPAAWDALLRTLHNNNSQLQELGDSHELSIHNFKPAPIPLDLKVILIGNEDTYEELLEKEERFAKLFRIKAHMTDSIIKNSANIRLYLMRIADIIRREALLPFNAGALAWLIDLGSHLCEDQKRLSLQFSRLREIMLEADAWAKMRGLDEVDAERLEQAYGHKDYRANLIEEEFMEEYDRGKIKVKTSGKAVGQINGLSISCQSDFEFGLPHRISCTVGVGNEGIIDLEREAELGGPIHTKAMMILKSYLTGMFARKKPLVLSASLYFEQSYYGVEGDSASGAELAALLSALADVPARLDLAFTGALGNSGQIMAVGGVSRKIEGFYKVCARHGLTGTQGVIIPQDNVDNLMLSPEILDSVEQKKFFIYPVTSIEDALHLLTGMPAGKRNKNGFTRGSLFDLVDKRLEDLGCYAQNAFQNRKKL